MESSTGISPAPDRRDGFTLVELLLTVAILGILVSIAVPRFGMIREKGFDAQVRMDTRSAAEAEELRFHDTGTYTSNVSALELTLSPGSVISITAGNSGSLSTSFSLTVSHPGMTFSNGCTWTSDGNPIMVCA